MKMRDWIVRWSVRLALLSLVAGVAYSFRLTKELPPAAADGKDGKASKKEIELCRNLVISSESGGSLLSVGRAFTRRMRKGPFYLAAREMVVDHLDATLPESYFPAPTGTVSTAAAVPRAAGPHPHAEAPPGPAEHPSIAALKSTLQGDSGSLRDILPTVVGVTIRGLSIFRRPDGANAVPWLSAAKASAARGGLRLENGWSVEKGVTNGWKEAFLTLQPHLKLYHP